MQLFFNSEETSSAVLICAELQIAFLKLGLDRNTKRKRMIVQFGGV